MKSRGFTLIEVLVASLILFVAISSATIVFNGAVKSKYNATSAVKRYAYVPIIVEHIGVQVRRSADGAPLRGRGHLFGADYRWNASVERQLPIKVNPGGDAGPSNIARRALFWSVDLTIEHDGREQVYNFNVTGWIS